MNYLIEAVNHIQKAISLLGEDLVTLTLSSFDSLPAVALADELLGPADGSLPTLKECSQCRQAL
jgi:hypothetical protein